MKFYYIHTFGCQMNEYDSERIASVLESKGFLPALSDDSADIVVLNTCSVREKPQHKVESLVGVLRQKTKKTGKPEKVGIMGCVAQQEGEKFLKRFANVNFVLGTDRLDVLPNVLDRIETGERISDLAWADVGSDFSISGFTRRRSVSSNVTIMKGCNNFCSYCIVPYVRGKEVSRRPSEILDEIRVLADMGVKDVTLLGQNVNSYAGFGELLSKSAQIEGVRRLRFMTSHPKDFSMDIVYAMSEHKNICRYIHLPLQSGSDRILGLMNRKYSWDEYFEKTQSAKKILPDLLFSSDFIVGFPGETEADFEKTVQALRAMEYESIFAFNYSVRPGTEAEKLEDDVSLAEKSARLDVIVKLQEEITAERYATLLGKPMQILAEGASRRDDGVYTGRTVHNRIMNFTSEKPVEIGSEVTVTLTEVKRNTLFGILGTSTPVPL